MSHRAETGQEKQGPARTEADSKLSDCEIPSTDTRRFETFIFPPTPPTGRGKPGTPDTQRRPGRKPGPGPRIHRITPRNDGHTDVETQKRRSAPPVLKLHGTFDIQSPILENQIRKVVTQFGRKDADPGSYHYVAHPMPVVQHTPHPGCRGQRITTDAVPGAVRTYEQRTTIRYQVSEISAFYPDCW